MSDQKTGEHLEALYFAYRAMAEALETYELLDGQHLQAQLRKGADGMLQRKAMSQAAYDHLIQLADHLVLDSFQRKGLSPEEGQRRLDESKAASLAGGLPE